MKSPLRKALILVLSLVFAAGVAALGWHGWQYIQADRLNQQAAQLAQLTPEEAPASSSAPEDPIPHQPADPTAAALSRIHFAALQQVNPDVMGWIQIPDTKLTYPLLRAQDNDQYLKHSWNGQYNAGGSIFLECQNSPDLSDFNTILYGHRMRDGSMFAALKYYKDLEYWQAHPSVYLATPEGVRRYDIFAAYEAPVVSHTYRLGFAAPEDKEEFLDHALRRSVIDTGIRPSADSRILTLSTCTGAGYSTRWVVQAVLAE